MKILYGHQIFKEQKFGGISRYFNEISSINSPEVEIDIIDYKVYFPENKYKDNIFINGFRRFNNKMGLSSKSDEKNNYPTILKERLSRNDYDLYHPTYYDINFFDYVKKPFVVTVFDMIHEIYPEYFKLNDTISFNKKILCNKSDAIISISETTKRDLIDILKIDPEKITTILLASDFDTVIPKKPHHNSEIENYILFTGQRWLYKNFYFMVIAISEFLLNDKSLKLICTGNPFTRQELFFLRNLGIEKQIIHIYSKTDNELSWLYSNALCFIFPSLYEGFGFPLLEAFASKCPVISSNGGSLKEIGGEGVLFFDPKNAIELKDALSDVLFNVATKQKLIKNGLIEFQKYSWDSCRRETLNLYNSIN